MKGLVGNGKFTLISHLFATCDVAVTRSRMGWGQIVRIHGVAAGRTKEGIE